jgi:hypothetical protein
MLEMSPATRRHSIVPQHPVNRLSSTASRHSYGPAERRYNKASANSIFYFSGLILWSQNSIPPRPTPAINLERGSEEAKRRRGRDWYAKVSFQFNSRVLKDVLRI